MTWNPFRKKAATSTAEELAPEPKICLLPDYDDREDTQRIVTMLEDYRKTREASAEKLEEAAEETKAEASVTSQTMRSMPAFVVPALAQEDPAE